MNVFVEADVLSVRALHWGCNSIGELGGGGGGLSKHTHSEEEVCVSPLPAAVLNGFPSRTWHLVINNAGITPGTRHQNLPTAAH